MNVQQHGGVSAQGLWRTRGYPTWFTADTATAVGVALRTLAIILLGYHISGSTVTAGWIGSVAMIAQQVCSVFGGTFVDRHSRRALIIVNALVGVLCWGTVFVLLGLNLMSVPTLLVISTASSAINGFLGSATDAALKEIIAITDYPKARSLNEGRDAMVNMSGSPISGFLYGIYPWLPFLLSALAYAIAGVAATRLPKHEAPHDEAGNSFIRAFTEGWSWTFRKPLLVISVAAISVLNFGINGIQYAIQLHLASAGTNATYIGFISTGVFLSMFVGALVSSRLSTRAPVGLTTCSAFAFVCIAMLPMVFTHNYWGILISNSVACFPFPIVNALLLGFIFAKAPESMQGRVSVALTVPCNILTAFCSAAAGSLLARWGFSVAVIVFLTLMALSAIAIWVYPPIRRIPKASDWDKISL